MQEDSTNHSVLKRFDDDLTILTSIQEVLRVAYLKGMPVSDLSSLIHHDICVVLKDLLGIKLVQDRVDKVWEKCAAREQELEPTSNCLDTIRDEVKIISRNNYKSFSILDCLESVKELKQVRQITATFLALKLSSELVHSWPAHLISKKTASHWTMPVYFLRTRFFLLYN